MQENPIFNNFIGQPKIKIFFQGAKRKPKTHNYTKFVWGEDYVFESLDEGNEGYMTGYGKGIERGDELILSNGTDSFRYRVETIDYYSNPSNMWIAQLKKSYG
jgi:MioC protein